MGCMGGRSAKDVSPTGPSEGGQTWGRGLEPKGRRAERRVMAKEAEGWGGERVGRGAKKPERGGRETKRRQLRSPSSSTLSQAVGGGVEIAGDDQPVKAPAEAAGSSSTTVDGPAQRALKPRLKRTVPDDRDTIPDDSRAAGDEREEGGGGEGGEHAERKAAGMGFRESGGATLWDSQDGTGDACGGLQLRRRQTVTPAPMTRRPSRRAVAPSKQTSKG